jgi:hypothetical protein
VSRREKRIAAKEEKQQLRGEKRAVEVAKILARGKHSSEADSPKRSTAKLPTQTANPTGGIFGQLCRVSSDKEDRDGRWSWGIDRNWHASHGEKHVSSFLVNYDGTKTWREIFEEKAVGKGEQIKPRHVKYPIEAICTEAVKRLEERQLDDQDEIFRFRMTNLERLYGFIIGASFATVWFDPTHEIYPVDD